MKHLKSLIVAASVLAAGVANAAPAGSIFVAEPGADGFSINTQVFNASSYEIQKLTFDFTDSHTTDGSHIVIDGSPSGTTGPTGGSATFFGSGAVFGFNFTGFTNFQSFKFSWDPDSAISGAYGATGLDFIGAKVTALTTDGIYEGKFERVGHTLDVTAALAPAVPEPESYALLIAGLLTVGAVARRRATAKA